MEKLTICGVIRLNVTFGKFCEIWIGPLQLHVHLLESRGCKPICIERLPTSGTNTNNGFFLHIYSHAQQVVSATT
jgi:hypothetical protein